MRYLATHITRYKYQVPVSQCISEARITPRALPGRQRVIETRIHIDPEPVVLETRQDYFGNTVTAFSVFRAHEELTATAQSVVEVEADPGPGPAPLPWEEARRILAKPEDAATLAAFEYVFDSPYVAADPLLAAYAAPSLTPGRPLSEAVREITTRIHKEFRYKPKSTSIDMPLLDVFQLRRGVCQDFTHIMIGALRSQRLAARYVSGYLRSGADLEGSEASHAWVSVFIPGSGWLDLDPTNDAVPTTGHVTVAWGRDFGDVTPIKGVNLGGGKQNVDVEVTVRPV